jgi:membrane-associated phospholipid phosphatase
LVVVGARRALGLGLALAALVPARALAQSAPGEPSVSWARDGAITAAALAGAGLANLIPVDRTALWQRQLLPIDDRLKGRASLAAFRTSDVLGAVDVATPLGLLVGQGGGIHEASGKRLLVYGQALSLSVFLNAVTKRVVGRPRPYAYSDDPRVQAFAAEQGDDSRLSFYSGHASTTFAAALAGSYLYGQYAVDRTARVVVWGVELALAGATADLRTRSGSHFYSDVLMGAIVGTGIGFLVPYLHGGPAYHPSAIEWATIGGAPVVGVVIAELLPMRSSVPLELGTVALPWVAPGTGGIILARRF